MAKPDLIRNIITGEELIDGIDRGVDKVFQVAKTAYGSASGNVMIEHRASAPTISHDGVSNLDELEVSDPVEDMAIKVIKQASKRTNETAGDGTTLSAILSCKLYEWARTKIKAGASPSKLAKEIEAKVPVILEQIDKLTVKEPDPELLKGACIISAGDESLGELIYDVVSQVGQFGGINVNYVGSLGIRTKVTNGMYIPAGYSDPLLINDVNNNKSVLTDCPVIILSQTITRQDELLPILNNIRTYNYDKACFIADITGDALSLLEINSRSFDAQVVKPKAINYELWLKDIALFTGGKVFSGIPKDFNLEEYAGKASNITIGNRETTITGGAGNQEEIQEVIKDLQDKLKTAEPQDRAFLEDRISRLSANIATIYVGGASAVERGEVKLRVDDAVCASKTALTGGVVAGGGTCLRDISYKLGTGYEYLSAPYRELLYNAGLAPEMTLPDGAGFNLNTGEKMDMLLNSICDPAIVIKEAVINSHSVVAKLITTKMALSYEDRSWNF